MQDKKYKIYGVIGSTLFHFLIILLLILLGLKTLPKEEEGILVNLGNVKTGLGQVEPSKNNSAVRPKPLPKVERKAPKPKPKQVKPKPVIPDNKKGEKVETQNFDNQAPEVKSAEDIRKEKEEKERIRKQKERERLLEQERLRQKQKEEAEAKARAEEEARIKAEQEAKRRAEELARKKAAEEERKRREEQARIAREARNKVGAAFGKGNGKSSSEGDRGGSGNQGYVTGSSNSKNRAGSGQGRSGSGFSLKGRSLIGTLPQPVYSIQEEGVVVVAITVNKYGKVVAAEYQFQGSTTQEPELKKAAIEAAKKTIFNKDPNAAAFQKGTITYYFELN